MTSVHSYIWTNISHIIIIIIIFILLPNDGGIGFRWKVVAEEKTYMGVY